ncbi:hypothetical protein OHU25_51310 [Streptomyces sp. NBC_00117]|uniref:hypothetical protein n=1 Tax=Streptomyces sp. NBC_00117 TaxID=2975657 RepID=UPI00324E6CEB
MAQGIGLTLNQVKHARWPKEHRQPGESYTVHRLLASVDDEESYCGGAVGAPAAGTSGIPQRARFALHTTQPEYAKPAWTLCSSITAT